MAETIGSIAVLVGSLRKQSLNRKLANALIGMAPASLKMDIVEIGALPLYNQDDDEGGAVPATWTAFRQRMQTVDGVLFITPEYNRSMPAVLKNAIDVGSRPAGQSVWNAKPGAVISLSPGALGGFGANHHLRQSLVSLNVPAMQQPEAYLGGAADLFDEKGRIKKDETRKFLDKFLQAFAAWVHARHR